MTQTPSELLIDDVIDEINRAFDGVSREGGISLHEADIIDGYGSMKERAKARKLDIEARWQDVPEKDLEEYSILCFLDTIGFRYYIAAYMVWALRNFRTTDSVSADSTIYALDPPWEYELNLWAHKRYSFFTKPQAKGTCRFLRFMAQNEAYADSDSARNALEKYWDKFYL
jgi:hypothetical protein